MVSTVPPSYLCSTGSRDPVRAAATGDPVSSGGEAGCSRAVLQWRVLPLVAAALDTHSTILYAYVMIHLGGYSLFVFYEFRKIVKVHNCFQSYFSDIFLIDF